MRRLSLLLLMAAFFSGGCAGIIEFNAPKEFKDGKVKEDPPGVMAPFDKVRAC